MTHARTRIGRVTLKGGAELHTIGQLKAQTHLDRRRIDFIEHCAATYDKYLEDLGEPPEAMVIVSGGVAQSARVSWITRGLSRTAPTTMLAFASAVLAKEVINP